MKPEGSLPCSQRLDVALFPERIETSSHPHRLYFPPIYAKVFLVVSPLPVFPHINAYIVHQPSRPLSFDHHNNIYWRAQITKLLPSVPASLICQNSPFITLFSNILSLCYSLRVRDQVLHPYKLLTHLIQQSPCEAVTDPFSKPDEPRPQLPTILLKSIIIWSIHLFLDLPSDLLPLGFPARTLYAFLISPLAIHGPYVSSSSVWSLS
jgi:hypothetical protein